MPRYFLTLFLLVFYFNIGCEADRLSSTEESLPDYSDIESVRGWNILSNHEEPGRKVIERAADYEINHLQLSHQLIHDLRHVKQPERAALVNRLTAHAHEQGVEKVYLWDHSLYHPGYYPEKFRTGPDGTIDLDNPEFWEWIKEDYRDMLDIVPDIDGLILTFIETGARVEDQHSEIHQTAGEKLAYLVEQIASVVIDERGLDLYIRTFVHNPIELEHTLEAINLIDHPDIRVMTKEAPHDFFLTHPVSQYVPDINFPVIIEFDATHEYNGQGILPSIFPEVHLERWEHYRQFPNVIGYVARTDRFNDTAIIDTPAELNLYALHRVMDEPGLPIGQIYRDFITELYGEETVDYLKSAFQKGGESVRAAFYTLGLNTNSHSRIHYQNDVAYQRHVSGIWMDEPVIHIRHGVDKEFHYWKDVVNHLAPAWMKEPEGTQLAREAPWILEEDWLEPEELMNEAYLRYILQEKSYAVQKAEEALELARQAHPLIENTARADTLLHIFERNAITVQLYEASAKLFFGYRVYVRGGEHRSDYVEQVIEEGLADTKRLVFRIKEYPHPGPVGQFEWREDMYRALSYYNAVNNRSNNTFYRGFFPDLEWQGLDEEFRQKMWENAIN